MMKKSRHPAEAEPTKARAPSAQRLARMEEMKAILESRRDALQRALAAPLAHAPNTGDEADVAMGTTEGDFEAQLLEVESAELQRIQAALQRTREGTYGICTECSLPIPMARLEALPFAECCIRCQREKDQVWPGEGQGAERSDDSQDDEDEA